MTKINTPREEVLESATDAVTKQRNNTYGPPTQDFDKVAKAASTYGFSFNGEPLDSHHVAFFQILVKLSRITWSPTHLDSWVDTAGYAACGYECAITEDKASVPDLLAGLQDVQDFESRRFFSDADQDIWFEVSPDNFTAWFTHPDSDATPGHWGAAFKDYTYAALQRHEVLVQLTREQAIAKLGEKYPKCGP